MYVADVSTLPGEVDDHETAEQQGKVGKCVSGLHNIYILHYPTGTKVD